MDDAIVRYIRKTFSLLIGERTAEEIKITIGTAMELEEATEMEIRGSDLVPGLPKNLLINANQICEALREPVANIVDAVRNTLERTPPELASDIMDSGIVMTGGSSLLRNLDRLLSKETGMPVYVSDDALSCVALGTGIAVEKFDYVHGLELNNKNFLDDASFSVLLNVSIPLFHFGERSNKVRAAKAKLEQTRLQQQNLNEQMLLELTQAANNLDEAKLESELADRSLQQAEENMRVSRSQYDVGLETLSDHLEAQALWQQAYETKVDACFRLYLNYITYLKATGTLHDKL